MAVEMGFSLDIFWSQFLLLLLLVFCFFYIFVSLRVGTPAIHEDGHRDNQRLKKNE